jgi:hypothetical protein
MLRATELSVVPCLLILVDVKLTISHTLVMLELQDGINASFNLNNLQERPFKVTKIPCSGLRVMEG